MGPHKAVRFNCDIVVTVNIYIVHLSFGTRKVELNLFVTAANSLQPRIRYRGTFVMTVLTESEIVVHKLITGINEIF